MSFRVNQAPSKHVRLTNPKAPPATARASDTGSPAGPRRIGPRFVQKSSRPFLSRRRARPSFHLLVNGNPGHENHYEGRNGYQDLHASSYPSSLRPHPGSRRTAAASSRDTHGRVPLVLLHGPVFGPHSCVSGIDSCQGLTTPRRVYAVLITVRAGL